jgi:hypothetical protein
MRFRFSEDFVVDSDVEPWRREGLRVAMLGGPGSGKSWNNSLVAEQFLGQGGAVVIFQPRDEYFTLKEKFDVLSVGGVHAKDMEFALTSPSIYAKAVVEDGMSMIFYTSAAEDEEKLINWVGGFEVNPRDKAAVELDRIRGLQIMTDWMTVNEIRESEGLERVPGGDVVLGLSKLQSTSFSSINSATSKRKLELERRWGKPVDKLLADMIASRKSVNKICRELGISTQTFYRWAEEYELKL